MVQSKKLIVMPACPVLCQTVSVQERRHGLDMRHCGPHILLRFHVAKIQRTCAVPISAVLRGYLVTVPKSSEPRGPVFPESTKWTLAEIKSQFKELAAAAGVEAWGFEALRFTCLVAMPVPESASGPGDGNDETRV